jgi:hypothetical protein
MWEASSNKSSRDTVDGVVAKHLMLVALVLVAVLVVLP